MCLSVSVCVGGERDRESKQLYYNRSVLNIELYRLIILTMTLLLCVCVCVCQMGARSAKMTQKRWEEEYGSALEAIKKFAAGCLEQCEEVRRRHELRPVSEYNDDATFRGLVTEMLETKKFCLAKMELLLNCPFHNETSILSRPLRMAFRDLTSEMELKLRASPSADYARDMCKLYGLLIDGVGETNELGETPLLAACADGVSDDKLELLLEAGSDVTKCMDYEVEY